MSVQRFTELAEKYGGFELVHGLRDFEDRCMGGKGNTFWYCIIKDGKLTESFIGTFSGGVWKDIRVKGSGKSRKESDAPSGSTIKKIAEYAYLGQEEDWVKNRKPSLVNDSHPHFHYVYGFGDKALDVSEEYGVTIGFSDLKDVPAGFRLREINTGDAVELP